ncbi:MAG: DUF4843 domain-containing protein [Ferruginibacter sp.]|nr:DUF4843 domain-containing protein [Ferruginibacter sp.]
MKIKSNILFLSLLVLSLIGCKKNEDIVFEEALVEIDWASYIARTSGYPFTIFTRVPTEPGRAVYNAGNAYGFIDPLLLRSRAITDTIRMRINLVSKKQPTAQNFEVRVAPTYTTALEGTTNGTGVHFQLLDRTVTIPANSSFGFCRWVVRNPGVTNNLPVTVVFQLLGNGQTKVNENYQYIGWSIDQL